MLLEKRRLVNSILPDILLGLTIVAVTITSFNLGKMASVSGGKTALTIQKPMGSDGLEAHLDTAETELTKESEVVVSKASKLGVYHFPWCPGAGKIAERNRVVYATEQAAIDAGYTLAGNCTRNSF